ncbi:MAG: hypothetical protein MJZ64_01750 [Paludibacteraceae bacterium]|nr:hypothetical protein [Paludibacteraceae bacterium]
MRILEFAPMFKAMCGKLTSISDWWVVRRYGKFFTGHKNRRRNYKNNPVTDEERKTQERLKRVVATYRAIDRTSDAWRELVREYYVQRRKKKGIKSNVYAYYVHREMAKLKAEGDLAADPSKNIRPPR